MSCVVKCRCGKATIKFNKLNPGDIKTWDCPRCPTEKKAPSKEAQKSEASKTAKAE